MIRFGLDADKCVLLPTATATLVQKKAYPSNITSYKQQARLNPFPVVEIAVAVKKEVKV